MKAREQVERLITRYQHLRSTPSAATQQAFQTALLAAAGGDETRAATLFLLIKETADHRDQAYADRRRHA